MFELKCDRSRKLLWVLRANMSLFNVLFLSFSVIFLLSAVSSFPVLFVSIHVSFLSSATSDEGQREQMKGILLSHSLCCSAVSNLNFAVSLRTPNLSFHITVNGSLFVYL